MKKIVLLVLMAFSVLVLSACGLAAGVQGVVELPSPLQLAIFAGVTFLVTWLFTQVAARLPWLGNFLGQYVDEVSAAVAGSLVLAIQNALGAVPPAWEGVANAALALLVAILSAIGLVKTARKARVPGFRG